MGNCPFKEIVSQNLRFRWGVGSLALGLEVFLMQLGFVVGSASWHCKKYIDFSSKSRSHLQMVLVPDMATTNSCWG